MWSFGAHAQQAIPVIGFLGIGTAGSSARLLDPLRRGLNETGYIEGRNVLIEQRWAEGQYDRLPALAAELVRKQVSVIVAGGGTQSALAAKSATGAIPIVFQAAVDPVAAGLVTSFERPGGNLTGVSNLAAELGPKRLELLREAIPSAKKIAILVNPTNVAVSGVATSALQAVAVGAGLQLDVLHASTDSEFSSVFSSIAQSKAGGLVIVPDLMFVDRIERLAALTLQHTVPAIFQFREFASAGGLMSYGGNITDAMRQVGVYAGRILSGSRPADLPVQQFTKIELVVNLKTAKALGLNIPLSLLGRADEVIE
jgi:putative ABC transport system substrate-binding protein